jgi:hypothetical protein
MAIFAKNKATASGANEENMLALFIKADGTPELVIAAGTTAILTVGHGTALTADTWAHVGARIDYGATTSGETTGKIVVNKTLGTAADTSSGSNKHFIEFANSSTFIGTE